jgi:RimJ/RimL family protein N-acetyltransferase
MIAIRPLGRDDATQYREFRLEALRESPTAFTSTYDEESVKPLSVTIDRLARDVTVGAFDGEDLVGIAGMTIGERKQVQHKATLFGMAVAPAAMGRGIGMALVFRIVELATATDGLSQIGLTVSEGNVAAERLYKACGFEEWGSEPAAVMVDGQAVAKVHMIRWL